MYVGGFLGRDNFGSYINVLSNDSIRHSVEVGTHRGEFASQFLSQWNGPILHCVDPYITNYDPEDPISLQEDRCTDYDYALDLLELYKDRYTFHKTTSLTASKLFDDNTLQFVYVDARHQKESVEEDLRIWWPKVCKGGVLAGHDIICTNEVNGGWGQHIQPVVELFALIHNVHIHLVPERDGLPWSYFFIKT